MAHRRRSRRYQSAVAAAPFDPVHMVLFGLLVTVCFLGLVWKSGELQEQGIQSPADLVSATGDGIRALLDARAQTVVTVNGTPVTTAGAPSGTGAADPLYIVAEPGQEQAAYLEAAKRARDLGETVSVEVPSGRVYVFHPDNTWTVHEPKQAPAEASASDTDTRNGTGTGTRNGSGTGTGDAGTRAGVAVAEASKSIAASLDRAEVEAGCTRDGVIESVCVDYFLANPGEWGTVPPSAAMPALPAPEPTIAPAPALNASAGGRVEPTAAPALNASAGGRVEPTAAPALNVSAGGRVEPTPVPQPRQPQTNAVVDPFCGGSNPPSPCWSEANADDPDDVPLLLTPAPLINAQNPLPTHVDPNNHCADPNPPLVCLSAKNK